MQCGHFTVATSSNSPHPHPLGHRSTMTFAVWCSSAVWPKKCGMTEMQFLQVHSLLHHSSEAEVRLCTGNQQSFRYLFTFHNILLENSSIRFELRTFIVSNHWNPCMLHNWTICLDHTDVFGTFHSTFIRSKDVLHNTYAYDPNGTHLTSYLLQLLMSWTNRKSLFQSSHLLFHQMACHCLMSRVMEQQRMERFLLKGNRYK